MRIGLLLTDGLGDLVCATGMIADIRKAYPDAFICAVARGEQEASILSGPTGIDEFVRYSPSEGNSPARVWTLIRKLRSLRLDVFVVATDIDHRKAPLLALATGARIRVGERGSPFGRLFTHAVSADTKAHKVESNRRIIAAWGIPAASSPVIDVTAAEREAARDLLAQRGIEPGEALVAVHAGTGGRLQHKQWPAAQYAQVLDALCENRVRPLLLGGRDEVAAYQPILAPMRHADVPVLLAGQTSIRMTAALISLCEMAFGSDTGVMHMAAAIGTPTYVLFGPTDEKRTAPFGATRVLTAQELTCRPCYHVLPYGCGAPMCMTGITVPQTLEAINLRPLQRPLEHIV